MSLLMERAGLDVVQAELQRIMDLCTPCRLWGRPKPAPKVSSSHPKAANDEVEFDYLFFENHPLSHMIDRASRLHRGKVTADRSYPSEFSWEAERNSSRVGNSVLEFP